MRYDNRDVGLSTDFDKWGLPNIMEAFRKLMKGEKVDAPYLLTDMAADAIGLLDALGIDRAHMVGASMGGMIAQIVAAKYPAAHALARLDHVDQRPARPAGGQARGGGDAVGAARGPGARAAHRARHQAAHRRSAARAIPTDPAEHARAGRAQRRPPLLSARARRGSISPSWPRATRVDLLKTVKVPTLVLHGDDDPLLPVECGRDVASLVPGAKIETFPGWGHDVPEQMVPKLVESISSFCKAA